MTPLQIIIAATFVSVACLVGVLASMVLRRSSPERKRLRALVKRQREAKWDERLGLTDEPNQLAERICRVMPRSQKRMGEMRGRLVIAGYRSPVAPIVYAASQIVCALAVGVVALIATRTMGFTILGLIAGFTLPGFWLSREMRRRGRTIRAGLPDVVDLLIVCLESGCGLDQAILKSGEELALAYPPLHDELALLANEIRAGKPRNEAFRRLSERTNVDDVRALVAMLVQTDRYGTSIAQALRMHAELLRTSRRQRAEERAGKASVKLVLPLVLCLFPAFYILTLGPAILQFIRVLAAAVAGE
jgi:tight adherence protein C